MSICADNQIRRNDKFSIIITTVTAELCFHNDTTTTTAVATIIFIIGLR